MSDLRDNKPPAKLVGDRLGGCFGEAEMEIAVRKIVCLAVEQGTWRVVLSEDDFSPVGYARDGFLNLIEHCWLIKGEGETYTVEPDLIKRLMRKRPEAFK